MIASMIRSPDALIDRQTYIYISSDTISASDDIIMFLTTVPASPFVFRQIDRCLAAGDASGKERA